MTSMEAEQSYDHRGDSETNLTDKDGYMIWKALRKNDVTPVL